MALALLGVGLILVANVATWQHFRLDAKSAYVKATSSLGRSDQVLAVVRPQLVRDVNAQVTQAAQDFAAKQDPPLAASSLTPNQSQVITEVVNSVIASSAYTQAWNNAEATLQSQQQAYVDGQTPAASGDNTTTTFTLDLGSLNKALAAAVVAHGYGFMTGYPIDVSPLIVTSNESTANHHTLLHIFDAFWWAFLLLGIAAIAGGIYLSRRRFRVGAVVGIDLAIGAALTVVAVIAMHASVPGTTDDAFEASLLKAHFDTITSSLIVQTVILGVIGILGALACAYVRLVLREHEEYRAESEAASNAAYA